VAQRVFRKTKVIATIGPACDSVETLTAMIRGGMNVARLNFSHGTHEQHRERIERIRRIAAAESANVGIMFDTRGIEIRTGRVEGGGVEIPTGGQLLLTTDGRLGNAEAVSISHAGLPAAVAVGAAILLDDGDIELRARDVSKDEIRCEVIRGGLLGDRKGVNLPDTVLTMEAMTAENCDDLRFAIAQKATYLAISFVRNAEDVERIQSFLAGEGASIPIIAKIETRSGVTNLAEIVAAADGTMVARGDLGVEIPLEQVPLLQKRIIRTTVGSGKPVITATQMLDSMERSPRPTRAEVSDVANAILDGTSAVMLSGETAAGAYPVRAVETMARLALEAEASLDEFGALQNIAPEPSNVVTEAVSQAAITMAHHLQAAAMIALTESGFTARSISKYRPRCPIFAVTATPDVVARLSMNWGVTALLFEGERSDEAMLRFALARGRALGCLASGDVVVATVGIDRKTGSTDTIRVLRVTD